TLRSRDDPHEARLRLPAHSNPRPGLRRRSPEGCVRERGNRDSAGTCGRGPRREHSPSNGPPALGHSLPRTHVPLAIPYAEPCLPLCRLSLACRCRTARLHSEDLFLISKNLWVFLVLGDFYCNRPTTFYAKTDDS